MQNDFSNTYPCPHAYASMLGCTHCTFSRWCVNRESDSIFSSLTFQLFPLGFPPKTLLKGSLVCMCACMCACPVGCDSPGNAEHHHTDDDHLEGSNDRGDEDVVQFARAWHDVQHVVLFDVTLGASETRVTAGIPHTQCRRQREKETGYSFLCS